MDLKPTFFFYTLAWFRAIRLVEDPTHKLSPFILFFCFSIGLLAIHHSSSLTLCVFLFLTLCAKNPPHTHTHRQLAFIKNPYLEVLAETGSKIYMGRNCMNKSFCLVYTKLRKCLRNVTVAASELEKHFVVAPWPMLYKVQALWNEESTAVWEIETEWNPSLLPWLFVVVRRPYPSPHKQMVDS